MGQLNVTGATAFAGGPFAAAPWNTLGFFCRRYGSGATADTFAISTSYLNPVGQVDKWIFTPAISGIDATTVLEWDAISVDANNPEDYEVWATTSIAGTTPAPSDFTSNAANLLTSITQETVSRRGAYLGAYAGQTVYIAFRHTSDDKYYLLLDDILVTAGMPSTDVANTNVALRRYQKPGNTAIVSTVKNLGAIPVTSIEMNYTLDGGAPVTQTITFGTPMNFLAETDVTFTQKASLTTEGLHNVIVWASAINGTPISTGMSDDTVKRKLSVVTETVVKKTFVQEFTGAWCQFCPDGAIKLAELMANDPDVIGVAIHNSDGMVTPEGKTIDDTYATGYPSATIDNYLFNGETDVAQSRNLWSNFAADRQALPVPGKVSIISKTYDAATRQLDVTVQADFVVEAESDFRFNLYLVEDSIKGTGNQFDQVNAYNTTAGHPMQGKGNPIKNYQHMHVVTKILGGAWGVAGIIPSTVTKGSSYTYTFSYKLPAETTSPTRWKERNIKLVALLQEYFDDVNDRNILNAEEITLLGNVGIEAAVNAANLNVYPNPMGNAANVSFTLPTGGETNLRVVDLLGKEVYSQNLGSMAAGNHTVELNATDIATGMYFLSINHAGVATTTRVTIAK